MRHSNAVTPPRTGLFWVCAATAAALLAACSKPEPLPDPVRAVKLVTVGVQPLQAQQEYAGQVRARTESSLGFQVGGKMARRPAELGQRVRAGQLLAELDPQDYRLAAQAAQAQVSAAQTQRDLAAADARRYGALKEQNFISGAELERRQATLRSAQATLEQAQAQSRTQGNQTAYTRLVASVAGVVTAVEAEPGQVVSAGTPVLRIAVDGPRDVEFAVPEDQLSLLAPGQSVQVRLWAGQALLPGKVREVAASADPVTRTYAVKVAIDSTGAAPPPLGATAYVALGAGRSAGPAVAMHLPTSALLRQGEGTAVWVYEPGTGTVRAQPVQLAGADGNDAVVASGLSPGMQVVAAGVHVLAPGQKVTVYQSKEALAQSQKAPAAPDSIANEGALKEGTATIAPAAPAAAAPAAPAPTPAAKP